MPQEKRNGIAINFCAECRMRKQRLELGAKQDCRGKDRRYNGFAPRSLARINSRVLRSPDRDCKHPHRFLKRLFNSPSSYAFSQYLGIRRPRQPTKPAAVSTASLRSRKL